MASVDLFHPRPAPSMRELRSDVYLALVLFVGAILSATLSALSGIYGDEQAPMQWALVYAVVISAPIAVRRRWPATVAVIVSVAYFTSVTLRIPEVYVGNIAMFIGLYTVGAWAFDRRRAMIVRTAIIVGMFGWLIIVLYRDAIMQADEADVIAGALSPLVAQVLLTILINVLYFGGAYYFGERAWIAASQLTALEQRTIELEREREVTSAQAVALDRVRIARELHDVVAHHVSAMGVQAGAARVVLETDPQASRRMLTGIESSAREALDELHRLLDTLRTPGATDDAAPSTVGLDSLPSLIAASDASGIATSFTVVGEPVPVPQVTQVNLYRIAQEALTNVRRHGGIHGGIHGGVGGGGVSADVRLRYVPGDLGKGGQVELEVVNSGRMVPEPRPGLGQLGMRERTSASGGSIEIGPRDRGGFRVRVAVPLTQSAPTSEEIGVR